MLTEAERHRTVMPLIEEAALTGVVTAALGNDRAQPVDWQIAPMGAGMGPATSGVYRVAGTAAVGGQMLPWSVVLKVLSLDAPTSHPTFADEAHPLFWRREALVYRSDMLDDLPSPLRAPRCYAITGGEVGNDIIHLWLEEIHDTHAAGWTLKHYAEAANALGRYNGAYLAGRPMPSYAWLVRDGSGSPRGTVNYNSWILDVIADPLTWEHPFLQEIFPVPVQQRLLRLWERREDLLRVLDAAPHTLCHLDAWRMNMAWIPCLGGEQNLVLLDWAFPGRAALGSDAGDLLGGSFCLAELGNTDPALLDSTIFSSYVEGLHSAGWHGDPAAVRLAYMAFTAVKYGCMQFWPADVDDPDRQFIWERISNRRFPDFARRQARLIYYLLDMADQAFTLLR